MDYLQKRLSAAKDQIDQLMELAELGVLRVQEVEAEMESGILAVPGLCGLVVSLCVCYLCVFVVIFECLVSLGVWCLCLCYPCVFVYLCIWYLWAFGVFACVIFVCLLCLLLLSLGVWKSICLNCLWAWLFVHAC